MTAAINSSPATRKSYRGAALNNKLATVTPIRQTQPTTAGTPAALPLYVMNRLKDDHRQWVKVLKEHRRGVKEIYDTKYPHAHPVSPQTPCMYCASVISDISAVSAATIRTLNQDRERDDIWNSEENRQARTVLSTAESTPLDVPHLSDLYGPNWFKVMDMCYRLTDAEPKELASILLEALRTPRTPPPAISADNGRDWGIPARWLVAQSMSCIPLPTTLIRTNSRSVVARISDKVSRVARETVDGV